MNKKQKRILFRLIVAFIIAISGEIIVNYSYIPSGYKYIWYALAYITAGYDILLKALNGVVHIKLLDENFLMAVASLGAFALFEYREACFVIVFYQIGELFQSYAIGKNRRQINALTSIINDTATIEKDGTLIKVDAEDVKSGDTIVIMPGERIALDGIVTEGASDIDMSAITGESVPISVEIGACILSGSINVSGVLKVKVTKEFSSSTASKIAELVTSASMEKSKSENFITSFSKYYTPIVVILAAIIAILPSVITGMPSVWIKRALIFLVVSCPCALVLSVPLSFFGAIGAASSKGVLIKGSGFIEKLSKATAIVMDKTGTVTDTHLCIKNIICYDKSYKQEDILNILSAIEQYSNHPLAKAICSYTEKSDVYNPINICENAGYGISADIDGKTYYAGNIKLMEKHGIEFISDEADGSYVYLACDTNIIGCIVLGDRLKHNAPEAISSLKNLGIKSITMLTGDKFYNASKICTDAGISELKAELLPDEKLSTLKEIIKVNKVTVYVGDGINDAPSLALADVGVSMGDVGSDAAIEASDIIICDDNLIKLPYLIRLSKKTVTIVKQNIIFSLGIKILVLVLGVFGLSNMWEAVFADVGVLVIAVLNSMRISQGTKNTVEL